MTGLLEIDRINFPASCVKAIYEHLREVGKERLEGVALLAGVCRENVCQITMVIIPQQTSYNLESGLLYSVEGEELFRVNKLLYEKSLTLIAQVHSHPGAAYHSDTDDAYPIVTVVGGVSIVIPNFAMDAFRLSDWAIYRLRPELGWVELEPQEVNNLITITD